MENEASLVIGPPQPTWLRDGSAFQEGGDVVVNAFRFRGIDMPEPSEQVGNHTCVLDALAQGWEPGGRVDVYRC